VVTTAAAAVILAAAAAVVVVAHLFAQPWKLLQVQAAQVLRPNAHHRRP
jgi:hypothetical protein